MSRPRSLKRFFPLLLALTVLASGCSSKANITYAVVRGAMPAVRGDTLRGDTLGPSAYRGMVVVVNFWASWCAPCRREQPGLEALWRELRGKGVQFIGVDYRDTEEAATAYLDRFGVSYPAVTDPVGRLGSDFGIPYIPATIIVDRAGQMRFRLVGAHDRGDVRALVERLL